jgi:site-specific recombinase XerD
VSDDLEPLGPAEALELYLNGRDELSAQTAEGQQYRLRAFAQWCDAEGIPNLDSLSGRDLYQYRVWRRDGDYSGEELAAATLRGDMATLRAFLQFCTSIDGVREGLFEQVPLPTPEAGGEVSDTTLDADRAVEILE